MGINAVSLLVAVTRSGCVSPPPAEMPERFKICSPAFSSKVKPVIGLRVGVSLMFVTVISKVSSR